MSTTYSPNPIIGGRAIANANPQIMYIHGNDKNDFRVVKCHDLSCFNTDRHLIAAIAVNVYNELIPTI